MKNTWTFLNKLYFKGSEIRITNGVDFVSIWSFREIQRGVCDWNLWLILLQSSCLCFIPDQTNKQKTNNSIDIFKETLDRRAHMKLRGSEWQTVWIVFRRDASERGREKSRRVTNDCMPLVARPQISHPMTDVSKAKTWNSFDFFLCTSYIDKYHRWRWGAKNIRRLYFFYLSDSKSNTYSTHCIQWEIIRTTFDWSR